MAVTPAELVVRFPEFGALPTESPGLIEAKIAETEQFLDMGAFVDIGLYETAAYYYAAALLLDSVHGAPMAVSPNEGAQFSNRYRTIFKKQILPLIHRRGHISGGGLT